MALWESDLSQIFTHGDYGFLGNLIPLVLVMSISWGLVKKPRLIGYIQLPLMLCAKVIFPFTHVSIILISFAIFIMNVIGSKGDLLGDLKEIPQVMKERLTPVEIKFSRALSKIRESKNTVQERAQEFYDEMRLKSRK